MGRPEFLYRGTPRRDVDQFVPKELVKVSGENKLVVSATPDKVAATKFIVPVEGLRVTMGVLDGIHYYFCADETRFRELDRGGVVYTLLSEGFMPSDRQGVWANPNPVSPISKEEFVSGLSAMVASGVKVHFVPAGVLEKLGLLGEGQAKVLRELLFPNVK